MGGRRAILAGRESEVADLYSAGKTVHEIAETLGVSFGAAYRTLKKSGVALRARGQPAQPRPPRPPHPAVPRKPKQPAPAPKRKLDDAEPIKRLIEKGLTAEEIARALGVSTWTLRARLKEFNLQLQPRERPKPPPAPARIEVSAEQISQLYYRRRLSGSATAKQLGIPLDTLRSRMRSLGLKTRNFAEAANLSRTESRREKMMQEARAVQIEPPGPDDRCVYSSHIDSGKLHAKLCGLPTIAKGSKYCATHQTIANAHLSRKPEVLALRLNEHLTVRCSRCSASEDDVRADDAAQWFRDHRKICAGATVAA